MRKFKRVALRVLVALVIVVGAAALAGMFIVRSGWFREKVRQGIVSAVEDATGGRVELGSFRFDPRHLVASITPFVLHGTEGPGEAPLVRVERITVGLRILSLFERRVDLAYMRVEQPQAHFVFYPNGTDNLPEPPTQHVFWADALVNLAVLRYEVDGGTVAYDGRNVPLNMRGEDLHILMTYDRAAKDYRGNLESKRVRMVAEGAAPAEFDATAAFRFEKSGVDIQRLLLRSPHSQFEFTGKLEDFHALHGTFATHANIAVSEAASVFSLPVAPVGTAAFDGRVMLSFGDNFDYSVAGRIAARGLSYSYQRLKIQNGEIRGDLRAVPDQVTLQHIAATAFGSTLTGDASLIRNKTVHFEGTIDGLGVRQAVDLATNREIAWNGTLTAHVTADAALGERMARVRADASIAPLQEGTPLEGQLDVDYDQRLNAVRLGDSYLATPSTRVDLSGTLGESVRVRARSSNLDDLLPLLAMTVKDAPGDLPVRLGSTNPPAAGEATLDGTISGPLENPRFAGQLALRNASVEGHAFDRFFGDVEAASDRITVRRLNLVRGVNPRDATAVDGEIDLTQHNGAFDDASIAAHLNFRNAQIGPLSQEFRKEIGRDVPVTGTVSGAATLAGTLHNPTADVTLQVDRPAAMGEQFDRLTADVHYDAALLRIANSELDAGPGKARIQGTFQHREGDWNNGQIHFDVDAQSLTVSRIAAFSKLLTGLDGTVTGRASGDARIDRGALTITSANGNLTAAGITLEREALGDLTLNAQTRGDNLEMQATAHVQQSTVQGQGTWRLQGDDPGTATMRIPRITIDALHRLVMIGAPEQQNAGPSFEGFVEGTVTVNVPLLKPSAFQAELKIDTMQLNPKPTQTLQLGVQAQDLVLKNTAPVVVSLNQREARIQAARFTARDTNLEASGAVPFTANSSANLAVRGSVNLVILQMLNPNLLARGNATLDTTIRGSLRDPLVNGRMELKNASLYLNDLPNGLDNTNGVVFFDRNRATIDKLTAETGGGTLSITGFVEFGSSLVYRLQAGVQQVRVRYPEDVSITASAQLALSGTSDASTLSGVLTLNRAAFNPHADMGKLLAQSAKPTPEPEAPSDYLRGMRFDVRIESAPAFELETSLTRDVQAEVDLRLRGTPLRPVLLGSISVNAGEIQLFGNRYSVNRGDIRFQNAVRIEPIFDVNLETKARGVVVTISLSGTTQKLNVNYSSDPPLQSRDIIALLAVGRGPTQSTVADSPLSADSTSFVEAGGGLLGQAVSEQLSSRLQRFFGASRVKIDPLLTGVENIPEARLTLEQQVSKDITLTYITNLNRTQEQIVQVQWDLSRRWSAIAIRDSNGLFGVDFTYRKGFK